MTNHEAIQWAIAPLRMACDTQKQLDWLERKIEWARLMVDGGLLTVDEACAELRKAGSNG